MDRKLLTRLTVTALLLLTGCTENNKPAPVTENTQSELASQKVAGDYINKYNSNQDQQNLLDASTTYLDNQSYDQAQFILDKIKVDDFNESQLNKYLFLKARLSFGLKDYELVLENLDNITQNSANIDSLREKTYDLLDEIQKKSLKTTFKSLNANSDSEKWYDIVALPKNKLTSIYNQNINNSEIAGWVKLALILKDDDTSNLQAKISTWQEEYPNHAGNKRITKLSQGQESAKKISLLLPLSGQMREAGEAIQAGFLSAYYKDPDLQKAKIDVINTEQQESITAIYDQALSHQADIIVGPLNKSEVDNLAHKFVLNKPTIALNYSNKEPKKNNLIQFGLSSQAEAKQVALRMHRKNYKRVLLLAPDTKWGHKMEHSFSTTLKDLGDNIVENKFYSDNIKLLSSDVQELLRINESKQRRLDLYQQIGGKIKFVPRRRQDIDAVFIVAKPQYARQLNSLLKFYYADDIPIYATSSIFSGTANKKFDRDLNGIIFCDMPWILEGNDPDHSSYYKRLYALGIDSYKISKNLNNLYYVSQLGFNGASGRLFVNKNNQIERQLTWARVVHGDAQVIN